MLASVLFVVLTGEKNASRFAQSSLMEILATLNLLRYQSAPVRYLSVVKIKPVRSVLSTDECIKMAKGYCVAELNESSI